MVFPDLFKEQMNSAFGIDGSMCRDEVHAIGYAVNTNHVPWCLRCLQRVKLTDRSLTLQFCLVAQLSLTIGLRAVSRRGCEFNP
jgi:hypothetical protein